MFGPLLEKDLQEFEDDWNSHPIRSDKHVGGPSRRPDDLFDVPEMFGTHYATYTHHNYNYAIAGCEDQLRTVDCMLWARCMTEESAHSPPLHPAEFEEYSNAALQSLGMTRDNVTHKNCKTVYLSMCRMLACD